MSKGNSMVRSGRRLLIGLSLGGVLLSSEAVLGQSSSVNLSSADTIYAIGQLGTAVTGGGADGNDNAYATDKLGRSVVFAGATFNLAPPGAHSAVAAKVIALPAASAATLSFLAAGVDGSQLNQTFIVTYTDGSTTRFTQSLSDWHASQGFAGEAVASSMPYRVGPTGSENAGTFNVYGYTLALNASKIVKSLTLPSNSHVIVLAVDVSAPGTTLTSVSVPLTNDNVYAIAQPGSIVSGGGADGVDDAYAADKLGSSLTFQGAMFSLAGPGSFSATSNRTIALPAAQDVGLTILATGVDGNQANQPFTVAYTDGTKTVFRQSLSDWHSPQHYSGEGIASSMPYRIGPTGVKEYGTYDLYAYSFPLDGSKTVKSLTLPGNSHVLVLAVDVTKAAGTITTMAPKSSLPAGNYTGGQMIMLSDATSGAAIYYTTDGSTPNPNNPAELYTGPFTLYATTTVKIIATHPGDANSAVTSFTYTINLLNAATPTFSLPGGIYQTNPVTQPTFPIPPERYLQIADATPGALIYYTLDGSTPNSSSMQDTFNAVIELPENQVTTVKAIAYAPPGFTPSAVATAQYTIPQFPSSTLDSTLDDYLYSFLYNNPDFDPLNPAVVTCAYYRAIGAVTDGVPSTDTNTPCLQNPDGSYANGLTFNQFKENAHLSFTGLDPHGHPVVYPGTNEHTATFVNLYDLNFTRNHHANEYPNDTSPVSSAAYVCNYPGPDFFHSTDQAAVDTAISNAQQGLTPLPCVAFDYQPNTDSLGAPVNGGKPFIRFLVFNAAGELLPQVDLDQRGDKPIPNSCSACHGVPYGATAGGDQINNNTTSGVGASYIPFDIRNFAFSSASGLTAADQQAEFKRLNLIVLNGTGGPYTGNVSGTTNQPDTRRGLSQLIHGWYDVGTDCQSPTPTNCTPLASATQQPYVPVALTDPTEIAVYKNVYGPMCRSCHVANNVQNYTTFPPLKPGDMLSLFNSASMCSPSNASPAVMPNAKVTFDRFWTSPFYESSLADGNDYAFLVDEYRGGTACYDFFSSHFLPSPPVFEQF